MSLLSTGFSRDRGILLSLNLSFWEGSCLERLEQQQRETLSDAAPELKGQGTEQFTQLTYLTSSASAEALFCS